MFTQCPECDTTFRVTAEMLRAAQGRVRCGRCKTVFDAMTYLMESGAADQAEEEPEEELTLDEDVQESSLEFDLTDDDLGKIFVVEKVPTITLPALKAESAPPAAPDDVAENEIEDYAAEGDPVEIITLEGENVQTSSGVFVEAPPAAPVQKVESRREAAARIDDEVRREIEAAFAADPTTTAEFVLPSGKRLTLHKPEGAPDPDEVLQPVRRWPQIRITNSRWLMGSAVLGLLLVGQLVHANRQSLVRSPLLGPAIGGLYAVVGTKLSPAWDVNAYELRQWGAAADPDTSGTLRVRASVLNGSDHAQPYPLLRLTLQDRFGSHVGSRDLEPSEYLHGGPDSHQLLGAGQRVDAEIAIVDPGKDAVGFEIDVCLRGDAGMKCAGEQARHSG